MIYNFFCKEAFPKQKIRVSRLVHRFQNKHIILEKNLTRRREVPFLGDISRQMGDESRQLYNN